MLDTFQNIVHAGSIAALLCVLGIMSAVVFKPRLLRKLSRDFGERKYILSAGIFISMLCGTIIIATRDQTGGHYVSESNKQTVPAADNMPLSGTAPSQEIKVEDIAVIEEIPFTKEDRDDETLESGQTKLVQAGKNGQKTRIFSVTYYDGKETSRKLKSETVTIEPAVEITAIGTKKTEPGQPNKKDPKNGQNRENSRPLHDLLPRF